MQRQVQYVNDVMNNIDRIIPDNKKNKFNLLMGSHILDTYDTKEDMDFAAKYDWPYVCCLKYYPPCYFAAIRIQKRWRGYNTRKSIAG